VLNSPGSEFSHGFAQTNKSRVIDSGRGNVRLQEGKTVYCGSKVNVTLPEKFGERHQIKAPRERQQGRDGKQTGSKRRQGLLDRSRAGRQLKAIGPLRVPNPDQTPGQECRRWGSGFGCEFAEEMKRLLA
jgi:hypothetical protein